MAKALTNGAIPMGAVAVKDEIYDTVTNASPENAIEFFHGYTYSAHPAACAASVPHRKFMRKKDCLTGQQICLLISSMQSGL